MRTLRARLLLSLSLALTLLWGAYGAWSLWNMRTLAEATLLDRLEHDAESLVAQLDFDAEGHPRLPEDALPRLYRRAFSGHYFLVLGNGGLLASRSLWGHDLPRRRLSPGEVRVERAVGPLGQPLLVRSAGYRKGDRDFTLVLAEDLSPLETRLDGLWWRSALWAVLALAVVLWVQARVVARGLSPLGRAQRQLRELEAGQRERLDEDLPEEIRPLVMEINRLVALQGVRLRRSREAFGNLAHALKGPLSLLAQLAEREEIRRHPDVYRSCTEAVESLRRRVDRELKRARLAGAGAGVPVFRAAREVADLVDLVRRIHAGKRLDFQLRVPPEATFRIDREDALEILGNLLDNAAKWARAQVRVSIAEAPHLHIDVEDDGPGVAKSDLPRLRRRGGRLDEQKPGHGLGLAIVQEAAAQYRGTVRFSRSELGGLRVTVDLPAAVSLPPVPVADGGGASD